MFHARKFGQFNWSAIFQVPSFKKDNLRIFITPTNGDKNNLRTIFCHFCYTWKETVVIIISRCELSMQNVQVAKSIYFDDIKGFHQGEQTDKTIVSIFVSIFSVNFV